MAMLKEYLESGDMDEAAACIGEMRLPQYDYYIVKRALSLAMDRKDREREAVSLLLSSLYGQGISPQQMQKARPRLQPSRNLICYARGKINLNKGKFQAEL